MRPFRQKSISRFDLERDLHSAGIREGDVLLVHSALSRVGWLLGGPQEAVKALQNVIGPNGTLVMPTFSFNLAFWNLPPFDPGRTPSRVGILTDVFWRMKGVLRTSHPTHSVAAWGSLASAIVGSGLDYEPLGLDSPLDRVRRAKGKILLLGVDQNRNSTVHLAESLACVPYFAVHFTPNAEHDEAWYVDDQGQQQLLRITEMPGSSEGFDVLEEPLQAMNVTQHVRIGQAHSQIMDSQALCSATIRLLHDNPALLLQTENPSEITRRRRRFMEEQGAKSSNASAV